MTSSSASVVMALLIILKRDKKGITVVALELFVNLVENNIEKKKTLKTNKDRGGKTMKRSELHDSLMNMVTSHARLTFNAPIYKLDDHLIELREICKQGTDVNHWFEAAQNSPIYKELIERFFCAEYLSIVDTSFVRKIGDIIVARHNWDLIEIKTSEHSLDTFNFNAESFQQYTKIPQHYWYYVHFLFYSSVDMSMKMVRMDRFVEIQNKVPIFYYKGVDGNAVAEAITHAPFSTTLVHNGNPNPDKYIDTESNVYYQFDLRNFPEGSVLDLKDYFTQMNNGSLYNGYNSYISFFNTTNSM